MDFTGVYHKASEQMCYPLNEDELIVNLKTGYDVKRVMNITDVGHLSSAVKFFNLNLIKCFT